MSGPPPSRYRVVERDRRLIVIDNLTGEPVDSAASKPMPSGQDPVALPLARASMEPPRGGLDSRGRTVLTTRRLYDLNGPRRIVLGAGAGESFKLAKIGLAVSAAIYAALVAAFPWLLLVPPLALLQPKIRERLRRVITRWLDGLAQSIGSETF